MSTRVVLEQPTADYDRALYAGVAGPHRWLDSLAELTDEDIAQYREEGYLCFRDVLDPVLVDAARNELEWMARDEDPSCEAVYFEGLIRDYLRVDDARDHHGTRGEKDDFVLGQTTDALPPLDPAVRARFVRKFSGFVGHHPPLDSLANLPPLKEVVKRLVGGPHRLFQDMALVKPPSGREKPWHQDHAYFNFALDTPVVGVWIPFHPVDQTNGCMHVLPGSHRRGAQPHFMRRDWQICDTDIAGQEQHYLPMRPGDVMVFDGKLAHGTPTNDTDEMRWAVQFHYVPLDATETDEAVRLANFGSEGKDVTC